MLSLFFSHLKMTAHNEHTFTYFGRMLKVYIKVERNKERMNGWREGRKKERNVKGRKERKQTSYNETGPTFLSGRGLYPLKIKK